MGLVVVVIDAHLRVLLRQLHHSTRILSPLGDKFNTPYKHCVCLNIVTLKPFLWKIGAAYLVECPATLVLTPCLDPALGRLLVGTLYITFLYQQMVKYLVTVTKNCSHQLWVVNEPEGKIFPEMVNMFVLNICGLWKQTTLGSLGLTENNYEISTNNIITLIEQ